MATSSQFRISTPSVMLNDIPFAVVNDSVEYTPGFGERTVEGASAGGGAIVQVVGEDVTALSGYLVIPVQNLLITVIALTILGMILGSITLWIRRRKAAAKESA